MCPSQVASPHKACQLDFGDSPFFMLWVPPVKMEPYLLLGSQVLTENICLKDNKKAWLNKINILEQKKCKMTVSEGKK
jgi:hypothetical protein